MSSRILHVGPYDGQTVQYVIDRDPEWILWAADHLPSAEITSGELHDALNCLDDWADNDGLDVVSFDELGLLFHVEGNEYD